MVRVLRSFTHVDGHFFRLLAQGGNEEGREGEISKERARLGPIFVDAAGVDSSEAGTFFQGGDGGGPDGAFGSGSVFEMNEADLCDWDFGIFVGVLRCGLSVFLRGKGCE